MISKTLSNSLPQNRWSASSGRVPSLDGIRGLSIIIVLAGHMVLPASLVGVSALGLKIFFFISGFLIARLLISEYRSNNDLDLTRFYIRRMLRLYPVLVFYVSVTILFAVYRNENFDRIDVYSVFLYFVNYRVIYYDHFGQGMTLPVGMFWSLSVEEHFYIFAPLAILWSKARPSRLLFVSLFLIFVPLILRVVYVFFEPSIINSLEIYWRSETRFDCIAFGMLLAIIPDLGKNYKLVKFLSNKIAFIAGCMVLLGSFAIRDAYFQMTWRFTIQSLALIPIISSLIFSNSVSSINFILNTRFMIWMGVLSYSLYVWHGGVMFIFGEWIKKLPNVFLVTFAELTATFVLATLSYYLLERPLVQLRHHFAPRKIGSKTRSRLENI
jgi:peptidoglycan/LPS O-acetylase OafA/YrhL